MADSNPTLCYCFQVTQDDLAADRAAGAPDRSLAMITARCQAGEARCQVLNPSGRCCLPTVREAIAAAAAACGESGESAVESPVGRNCCRPTRVQPGDNSLKRGTS